MAERAGWGKIAGDMRRDMRGRRHPFLNRGAMESYGERSGIQAGSGGRERRE